MAAGQLRKIIIEAKSDDKDIKKMVNSLGSLNKAAQGVNSTFTSLKNFAGAAAGASIFGFGAREIMGMADSMTLLAGRITALTGSSQKTRDIMSSLADIAKNTKTDITALSETFSRIAVATQRLNISTEAQLDLTKILQQSFRLSGASAEEATASTIQFTQALSFGQLRGQELRSVLSQNATLATIFGKAIEGSGKDIYKFAEAGGFTTKFVLKALADNFDTINDKADGLAQTFEQTLTLAMNEFKKAIDDFNTEHNINGKFANFVDYLIEKLPVLQASILGLATLAIPGLVASIGRLVAALNPLTLIIGTAAGVIAYFTIENKFGEFFKAAAIEVEIFARKMLTMIQIVGAALSTLSGSPQIISGMFSSISDNTKKIKELNDMLKLYEDRINGIKTAMPSDSEALFGAEILRSSGVGSSASGNALADAAAKLKEKAKTLSEQIGILNSQFNRGALTDVNKYVSELNRLETLQLKEKLLAGTITLSKFNEEISKNRLEGLATKLEYGALTIQQFNSEINKFKIGELDNKFKAAKITLEQYTEQMRKLRIEGMDQESIMTGIAKGTDAYISSVKSMSEQVGSIVEGAFSKMEDAIFQATKGATRSFADMTQAILDDITKMAIRMAIIKPLAGAVGGFFDFGAAPSLGAPIAGSPSGATLGGGFGADLQLAKGGVLDGPSFFGMGQGKTGVAGEAGPEAVLPLKRSADGVLGVRGSPTVINIINNGNNEVTTQEKTGPDGSKIIDVMIQAKVREGIANGMFDRQMRSSYGLVRKGV